MFEPKPFLKSRFAEASSGNRLLCVCPGFELRRWRYQLLADHLMDWLPDFAIRHDDLPDEITNITEYRKLIERAAKRIYDTKKTSSRGEIGELLLHAICRQFSGTFPTVSKVFYKTSSNDVVKGFDLVHTRYYSKKKELQLWLGEAKFYTDGDRAVRDAIGSIAKHIDAGFLTSEKLLLGGKISRDTPGYKKLEWLFEKETPLDKIFERLIIPVLIAYDSEHAAKYKDDESYNDLVLTELRGFQNKFKNKLPAEISIYCFYLPMDSKAALIKSFDRRLLGFK